LSLETPAAARAERELPAREKPSARAFAIPRIDIVLMVLLFTVAIIPRAAWTAYNDRAPKELNDPTFYSIYSDQIADGHGYALLTGQKTAYYPVGYPATVAGLKKAGDIFGWGRSIFSVKMMNGMFGAITVLLLYALGTRMFDRRTGMTAGLLQAVFPSQIYYAGTILSEPEFTMLVLAALLVLLWRPWSRDGMPWQQLLAAGLLLSAATMVRGILLVFPLVLLAVWLFYLRSKKRALIQTGILFAGIAVLTVPWSIRNTVAVGQLTGPSTNGDDLCIGNFLGARRVHAGRGVLRGLEGKSMREVGPRNREGVKIAIRDVPSHPFLMPKLIGRRRTGRCTSTTMACSPRISGHDALSPYRREVLSFAANAIITRRAPSRSSGRSRSRWRRTSGGRSFWSRCCTCSESRWCSSATRGSTIRRSRSPC
jgi:hypothetical protein